MPSPVPQVSAGLRGRGKLRRRGNCTKHRRKTSVAILPSRFVTSAGCNYLGPYPAPPPPARSCEIPSACEIPGPSPSKIPKLGCTQICTNSSGSIPKRALEATGGDGRTPKSFKTCGQQKTCGHQGCCQSFTLCSWHWPVPNCRLDNRPVLSFLSWIAS